MRTASVAARGRAIACALAERRIAGLWLVLVAIYIGLAGVILLFTSAVSRGGSLPDSVDLRLLPMTVGKWIEVYGVSAGSGWRFPLARLDMFWEPRPEWWQLSGTLLFVSLGFFLRMLLIAVLGALAAVILLVVLRRRGPSSAGVVGTVGGAGLAGVGTSVAAPLAAFAGG